MLTFVYTYYIISSTFTHKEAKQMQHLNIVPNDRIIVENKLSRMKELQQSIKVLSAELDMLKSQVIESYFVDHEEFKTTKGLLLASYKAVEMNIFNQSKFKEDHPDISKLYTEMKLSQRFLLK